MTRKSTGAHAQHDNPKPWCAVCRWEQMTLDQQLARREAAREQWRRANPERSARRDAILADARPEACLCGSPDATAYVTDYDAGTFVWRCRVCARSHASKHRQAAA